MGRDINFRNKISEELSRKCCNCASEELIEYHHIVPICVGGNDIIENIVPLCRECHYKAHGKVWRVNRDEMKRAGKKPKVEYKQAKKYIKQYFDGEITGNELKEKLRISKRTSVSSIRNVKKYIREEMIDKEKVGRASKVSQQTSASQTMFDNLYRKKKKYIKKYVEKQIDEVELRKKLNIKEKISLEENYYIKRYMDENTSKPIKEEF